MTGKVGDSHSTFNVGKLGGRSGMEFVRLQPEVSLIFSLL